MSQTTGAPDRTNAGAPAPVLVSSRSAGPPVAAPGPDGRRFGVGTASALVVGSVIGTALFALPSALAVFGPISVVAFVLVTIGAVALALALRGLAARLPGADGPYGYARDALGEFAGFLIAWSYWITAWAGNAAIVVAWVGYLEVFWNTDHQVSNLRCGWASTPRSAGCARSSCTGRAVSWTC